MSTNRLTVISTRAGDSGFTRLVGSDRYSKDMPIFNAIGDVDEANSAIGLLLAVAKLESDHDTQVSLHGVQQDLLDIGGMLASTEVRPDAMRDSALEIIGARVDAINSTLESLQDFVLPGGHPRAALAHVARTVVRRAERSVVRLLTERRDLEPAVAYLNRLSDLLFLVARAVNASAGAKEETWTGGRNREAAGLHSA